MPLGGQAFEEFTAAYLREVQGYVVMSHVDYFRSKDMIEHIEKKFKQGKQGREPRQGYWSDIDVLGLKKGEAIVVSCDENCSKKVDSILKELRYAEEYVRKTYGISNIRKMYVFAVCWSPRKCPEKFKKLEENKIEVKSFVDMVREFINKLRKDYKVLGVRGKFTDPILWALRELDLIRTCLGKEILPPIPREEKYRQNIVVEVNQR
ncbi:MAG: hypothetical protein B6U76_00890 [Desulfurococcales archaeon ex4484_217_2]|nr:MAG: hypothetical protein B6U76_00890 [Desulfurococcales archaeon ex4484_217_2]